MSEFSYAKGRISESLQFITSEMKEFDNDYANKTRNDYNRDFKLQKLMDRTVENILNALIEVCGTILIEEGIAVESYKDSMTKAAAFFGFSESEMEMFGKLAIQRNRLVHRYLDYRWQAVKMFMDNRDLIKKLLTLILARENEKHQKDTNII